MSTRRPPPPPSPSWRDMPVPTPAAMALATLLRGAETILQRLGDGGTIREIASGAELVRELAATTAAMQRACEQLPFEEASDVEPRVQRMTDLVGFLMSLSGRTDLDGVGEGKLLAQVTGALADLLRATADLHATLVRR